jgi:hypothetical protein
VAASLVLGIALVLGACSSSSSPSPEDTAGRAIILGSHGLGPVGFGTSKERATSELTQLLGPPSGHGANTGCGRDFTEVHWDELAVEFHDNSFSGYRDINGPKGDEQLGPEYTVGYPVRPAARTATGIALGDSLGRVRAAYSTLSLVGADRHESPDGLSFVDNSLRSPAPPEAKIIEIRIGTCGSY